MRIEGMNEFLSRFVAKPGQVAAKIGASPFVKKETDTLELSGLGKRLRFRSETTKLTEGKAATGSGPIIQLMDSSLSEVEGILEQMKALTELAKGTNPSALDRVNMQIEMEELKRRLSEAKGAMSEKLAKMSGRDKILPDVTVKVDDYFYPTEATQSLLERARDRLLEGEAWDVAESYEVFEKVTKIRVGDREIEVEEGFQLPSDIDLENGLIAYFPEQAGGRWFVTDDKDIPTVRQRLEKSDAIILMDADSAAKGFERIEKELDLIKEMRKELAAFSETNRPSRENAYKMSEGEIDVLIGEIAQEAEARKSMAKSVTYSGDTGEQGQNDKNKKASFQTQLGTMEFLNGARSRPRLTSPANKTGEIFAKCERLFDAIAERLAGGIEEGVPWEKVKYTWIDQGPWVHKAV
jgi:hypothetical protein